MDKAFTGGPDACSLQEAQVSDLCACFGENEYLSLTMWPWSLASSGFNSFGTSHSPAGWL